MNKKPWWVTALAVIVALPIVAYPELISRPVTSGDTGRTLLWIYPLYLILGAICAWASYGRRNDIFWILIVIMTLSNIAIWML